MDGVHDMGGMHGFGKVPVHDDEPSFRADWEPRILAIMGLLLERGVFNIDAFRFRVESLEPALYLQAGYYGRWLEAVRRLTLAAGVATTAELEAREAQVAAGTAPTAPAQPASRPPLPPPAAPGYVRDVPTPPRFAPGDDVRARNLHPPGHTRIPRYVRGHRGRIARVHPGFVFPDTHAHGLGEQPQLLYNVRFDGREVWGEAAEPESAVHVDLFESYLERA